MSTETEVPTITAREWVYPSVEAGEPFLAECRLVWDEDREVFNNIDMDEEWILDEDAHPEHSEYEVRGTVYDTLAEAKRVALRGRRCVDLSEYNVVPEP